MLDQRELDNTLEELRIGVCKNGLKFEEWIIQMYEEHLEYGCIYMYTDDFMPDTYFETLQLLERYFERNLDMARVAVVISLQKDFCAEQTIEINDQLMKQVITYLQMGETNKYN